MPAGTQFSRWEGGGELWLPYGADNRGVVREPMSSQLSVLRRGIFTSRRGKFGAIQQNCFSFAFHIESDGGQEQWKILAVTLFDPNSKR